MNCRRSWGCPLLWHWCLLAHWRLLATVSTLPPSPFVNTSLILFRTNLAISLLCETPIIQRIGRKWPPITPRKRYAARNMISATYLVVSLLSCFFWAWVVDCFVAIFRCVCSWSIQWLGLIRLEWSWSVGCWSNSQGGSSQVIDVGGWWSVG